MAKLSTAKIALIVAGCGLLVMVAGVVPLVIFLGRAYIAYYQCPGTSERRCCDFLGPYLNNCYPMPPTGPCPDGTEALCFTGGRYVLAITVFSDHAKSVQIGTGILTGLGGLTAFIAFLMACAFCRLLPQTFAPHPTPMPSPE